VEQYRAALVLDFEHKRVEGTEWIRLRASDSPSDLELDADEIIVESALVGKSAQSFSQSVDTNTGRGRLNIHLNRSIQRNRRVNLQLAFHGSPTKGLVFSGDQAYTVYNTSHWMIVNHDPEDLATFRLSLTVPATMTVIGNGRISRPDQAAGI
jgi:aminopeptidase N